MKYLHLLLIALLYPLSSHAYYPLSPYSYYGGDPINCIDPTGKDVVVLNYTEGEHMAMLIQNEDGKWQYYSINGDNMYIPLLKCHTGGRTFNDIAVGSWNSPQEFFQSAYNVRDENSKNDKSKNHYGFSEGYLIKTTSQQDETIRNSFIKSAEAGYNPVTNNCATAVQKALIDAEIPVSKPSWVPDFIPIPTQFGIVDGFNGYKMNCDIKIMPSSTFKSIIKWNPSGQYLHK